MKESRKYAARWYVLSLNLNLDDKSIIKSSISPRDSVYEAGNLNLIGLA